MAGLCGARPRIGRDRDRDSARAMTGHQSMPRSLWWMLAGLTFAWGFNWTAMKFALAEFTPWIFRSLCIGFGALLLFGIARAMGNDLRVPKKLWWKVAVLAFFNVSCWNVMIASGPMMVL